MTLQDRINDEINNIKALPDTLTKEQREHLKTLKNSEEKEKFVEECIKNFKEQGQQ